LEKRNPGCETTSLFWTSGQCTFKIEEISIETSLCGEFGKSDSIVRRDW
jgi:hypothetical protein